MPTHVMATAPYPLSAGSRNGYGYQPTSGPRSSEYATYASG